MKNTAKLFILGAAATGLLLLNASADALAQQSPDSGDAKQKSAEMALAPLKSIAANKLNISVLPEDVVIKGKHGLKIKVTNNSDRAVIFNGEQASASLNGNEYKCMDIDEFDELFARSPAFSTNMARNSEQTVLAAVSVGGWQTVGDMIKNGKTVLKRYGRDEQRRQEDQERFGQRILWPGDSSEGIVLFQSPVSLTQAVLKVPASSFLDVGDQVDVISSPNQP